MVTVKLHVITGAGDEASCSYKPTLALNWRDATQQIPVVVIVNYETLLQDEAPERLCIYNMSRDTDVLVLQLLHDPPPHHLTWRTKALPSESEDSPGGVRTRSMTCTYDAQKDQTIVHYNKGPLSGKHVCRNCVANLPSWEVSLYSLVGHSGAAVLDKENNVLGMLWGNRPVPWLPGSYRTLVAQSESVRAVVNELCSQRATYEFTLEK